MPNFNTDLKGLGSVTSIFLKSPEWSKAVESNISVLRHLQQYSGTAGVMAQLTQETPVTLKQSFLGDKKDEFEIQDFFQAMRGRWGRFWLPGRRRAFSLDKPIPAGSDQFEVEDNQFSLTYRGTERVYFEPEPGVYITRQLMSIEEASPGVARFFTDPFLEDIPKNCLIGRLYLMRFDQDGIEFKHIHSNLFTVTLTFTELINEYTEL